MALEALEGFFRRQREAIASALNNAKTPDEAFHVACRSQVVNALESELKADAAFGSAAANELMKEE